MERTFTPGDSDDEAPPDTKRRDDAEAEAKRQAAEQVVEQAQRASGQAVRHFADLTSPLPGRKDSRSRER